MLSEALDKDTVLKVTMQIPPTLLSPIVKVSLVWYYPGISIYASC